MALFRRAPAPSVTSGAKTRPQHQVSPTEPSGNHLAFARAVGGYAAFAVPDEIRPRLRSPNLWRWLALLLAVGLFLAVLAFFYIPGKGFTAFISFGDQYAGRYLAEVDPRTTYLMPDSFGYDSQWYAQLAVDPDLGDPRLRKAIDNLPYRARRILFCWTAYAFGLGNPRWVLQAYAVQNIVAWLLLGWLLARRWLPPTDWANVVRWLLVMFSFGLIFSLRGALVDGPGLLLIAAGVALAESGRPWLSAALLGISGLGKETSVLAGACLVSPAQSGRDWLKIALRGFVVALPLLLWSAYLVHRFGITSSDAGARNFALPFSEFWHKAVGSVCELLSHPPVFAYSIGGLFTVVSLGTQVLFFALRPRWRDPWWRVGAAFGVLMVFLGESVWEGYPAAAARVLLPMLLAFNLTVPRGRRWWPVLLLGNITILSTPNFIRLPVGIEPQLVDGPSALLQDHATGGSVRISFEGPWYQAEQSFGENWRWTAGDVEVVVHNPHAFPVVASLSFGINSRNARNVRLLVGDRVLWHGTSVPRRHDVSVSSLLLQPGTTRFQFRSERPAEVSPQNPDTRALAFRVLDLNLLLSSAAPDP